MKLTITGPAIPNIPWQPKPAGNPDVVWRYDGNPVIGRRPLPRITGIFNSAVVPFRGEFIGVFRTEGMDRVPHLHVGRSADGFKFTFDPKPIEFKCDDPEVRRHEYAYDPRVTPIEGVYYVTWCNGYHGPTIGVARTKDFVRLRAVRKRLPALQSQRRAVPAEVQREVSHAQPPERHGPYAVRRHLCQRKPRPGLLGQAPPRHGPRLAVVAGHQDRRRALARSRRAKAGCFFIMA